MSQQLTEKSNRNERHFFSLVVLLIMALIFTVMIYQQADELKSFGASSSALVITGSAYLALVSVRAFVLLMLSFADRFFRRGQKPLTSFPLVTVLIPCYNEQAVVRKSILSALEIDYPNLEILVIDDGSRDLTWAHARELEQAKRVRVIHQKNQGKAEALNRGISEAMGEYILCVDADSLLGADCLKRGMPYFVDNPRLAAVAGNVRIGNHSGLLTHFQRLEYIVGLNFQKTAQSFLSAVTIVPGPIGLFRKAAVLDVGGYSSKTFAEDCDLTMRLLLNGYKIRYCDEMVSVTEAPEDFESLLKQRYRWSRGTVQAIKVNAEWLLKPWRSLRNFLILAFVCFETLVIPFCNFLFTMLFIQQAVLSSASILGPFVMQMTLLEMVLLAYSIFYEKSVVALLVLAPFNRVTYGLAMEILRFFSILDELLGLPMNWNKLERKGLS